MLRNRAGLNDWIYEKDSGKKVEPAVEQEEKKA